MSEVKAPAPETYIGDGVYASFDGYKIRLRGSRILIEDDDGQFESNHEIYFEPRELRALVEFAREQYRKAGI